MNKESKQLTETKQTLVAFRDNEMAAKIATVAKATGANASEVARTACRYGITLAYEELAQAKEKERAQANAALAKSLSAGLSKMKSHAKAPPRKDRQ